MWIDNSEGGSAGSSTAPGTGGIKISPSEEFYSLWRLFKPLLCPSLLNPGYTNLGETSLCSISLLVHQKYVQLFPALI
jgi:hypothetical protein